MKVATEFFFIIAYSVCIVRQSVFGEESIGLYNTSDAVFILDQSNFKTNVNESDSCWIIEFYNSWCGYCIKFAPVWKEFALENADWWPIIRLGAVDCASDVNRKLCHNYDIKGFPAFKIFPPGYNSKDNRETFHEHEKYPLQKRLLDFVSNSSQFLPPESWPRLSPIVSMQDIWDETKDHHNHVAFVFEDPESYVGRQVILDTYRYKPLLVRRMVKGSVLQFGISVFPSLYLINRDGTFTRMAKTNNTRDGMVSALKTLLTPAQLTAGNQYVSQRPKNQDVASIEDVPVADTQDTRAAVYMQDLESALHYTLRQEIAICRDIRGEKLAALKNFINVLAKYFPGREEVRVFLQMLAAWLGNAEPEITGDQWINILDEIQTMDVFLPERIEWVGCAGSEPRFRGYPCAMWTLFHTLTVAAYQHGRENPKDLPLDVLGTIQKYMKYFFGCEVCVQHFMKMASTITSADKTPQGAILWLWMGHNKANKRLHGDNTEDPKHPKIQFPPATLCSDCYKGGHWNKDKILDFLVRFYGKDGLVSAADDSVEEDTGKLFSHAVNENKHLDWWELQQRKKDLEKIRTLRRAKYDKLQVKKVEKLSKYAVINQNHDLLYNHDVKHDVGLVARREPVDVYTWGFSDLDMGMCVLFYVLCTAMIIILYYHFIVRRKYRPWSAVW